MRLDNLLKTDILKTDLSLLSKEELASILIEKELENDKLKRLISYNNNLESLNANRATMFFNLSSPNCFRSHVIAHTLQGDIEFMLSRNSRGHFGIAAKVSRDVPVSSNTIDESHDAFKRIKNNIVTFLK